MNDGSAGLKGDILKTDNWAEIKLFAATFLSAATSEKLNEYLQQGDAPDAQTLMRFMLAGFTSHDIAIHFDRAHRNITGARLLETGEVAAH